MGVGGFEPPMFTLREEIYSLLRHHHRRCAPMLFFVGPNRVERLPPDFQSDAQMTTYATGPILCLEPVEGFAPPNTAFAERRVCYFTTWASCVPVP